MDQFNSSIGQIDGSEGAAGECPFHNSPWRSIALPWQTVWWTFVAICAVYFSISRWKVKGRPGPEAWPVIGCVPSLVKNWTRYHDFLFDFFDAGHRVVWIAFAFNMEGVYVADPQLVEYMLKTNFANYPKGQLVIKHMDEFLGKGIFNSDHDRWKVQRKIASHEFASSILRDFSTGVFKEHGVRLLQIVADFARSNRSMNFQDLVMRMTLDATAKTGFGVELGCLSKSLPDVRFATAFDLTNELSFGRYIDPLWQLKRVLEIGEEKWLRKCLKVLDSFSYDVIRKRREEMKALEAERNVNAKAKPDLLSRFMAAAPTLGNNNEASGADDQTLRDVVLNFIIAGRDTTGITLSWFLYMLCLHPEVEQKVLDELRTKLELEAEDEVRVEEAEHKSDPGISESESYQRFAELLTYQNLGKLHYLHAVLSETLRLYPPVPIDGKTAMADDVLPDGTRVRKGTMVSYSAYAMGRLERVWGPDAKKFNPDRWLNDDGIFQSESPFKFPAFHAGPRACLGKDSAYLQMKITAALLIRFFKFQLVPDHEVTYRPMFVLTMKKGLWVTACPR